MTIDYDELAVDELAVLWRSLQHVGLKDDTEETSAGKHYFRRLPHDSPERAFDVMLSVLRSETDTAVLAVLARSFLQTLIYKHSLRLIDRIESEAVDSSRLRWLLGGAWRWAPQEPLKARLQRLADTQAWQVDKQRRRTAAKPVDSQRCRSPSLHIFGSSRSQNAKRTTMITGTA